jgi:hypothetical protein
MPAGHLRVTQVVNDAGGLQPGAERVMKEFVGACVASLSDICDVRKLQCFLKQCTDITELKVQQVCAKRSMLKAMPDASDLIDAVTIERYHHDSEAYPSFTDSTIRIGNRLRLTSYENGNGGYATYCPLEERSGELVEVGSEADFVDAYAVRHGGEQTAKQIIADCLFIAGLTSVRLCDFLHMIRIACNYGNVQGADKWTETANQFLCSGDFTKSAVTADVDPAQNTGLPLTRHPTTGCTRESKK